MSLLRPAAPPRSVRFVKRTVDIVGGTLAIIVALPLIPLIAIAIRLDSRGPILYWQDRVATDANGNEFHFPMCKFRTMRVDAEAEPVGADAVRFVVEARAVDRTGVEMEALTGAAVAALTLYDMIKGVDRTAVVERIQLLEKVGGKTGHWTRDASQETNG